MVADQRGNLPLDLATFVGRNGLLVAIIQLVPHVKLLTLTGPGGVGKTRLAIRASSQLQPGIVDSVWLVDCGGLSRAVSIPMLYAHMALAMGIRSHGDAGIEVILGHLHDRRALLILDGCEHLLPQIRTVTIASLRAAPRLRIMGTSRERLDIDGEHNLAVPPLGVVDSALLFTELAGKSVGVNPESLRLSDIEVLCRHLADPGGRYGVGRFGSDDAGAAVEQRVDPVEILAYVSESDGKQRAFDVWIHKAAKAGWAVTVETTAPPGTAGSECGTVAVEGLRYRIHHGRRVRRPVGYTPATDHLISATIKQLQGEDVPGTQWVWEFTHAAWAEPVLPGEPG